MQTTLDSGISEWGNPPAVMGGNFLLNQIGRKEPTEGSEPSQYLQEKKAIAILLVVASERGTA